MCLYFQLLSLVLVARYQKRPFAIIQYILLIFTKYCLLVCKLPLKFICFQFEKFLIDKLFFIWRLIANSNNNTRNKYIFKNFNLLKVNNISDLMF
ncbi:hypothetical protein Barb6_02100 [Bacteroidales bacterium Barb6]|nr:hypothetical protein Barb6_02100 [Bacteroidales bacterium Barb6]